MKSKTKNECGVRQTKKEQLKKGWLKNRRAKITTFALSVMCAAGLLAGVVQAALADSTVDLTIEVTYDQTGARSMWSNVNDLRTNEAWITLQDGSRYNIPNKLANYQWDYGLEKTAMIRAKEIAVSYSHTRPDGSKCFTAYSEGGASTTGSSGENIAAGQTSVEQVMTSWAEANEPYTGQGHRRNMLGGIEETSSGSFTNYNFAYIGIAHVKYQGVDYWVQEFSSNAGSVSSFALDDTTQTADVTVASSNISERSLTATPSSISMLSGESENLPQLSATVKVANFWSYKEASSVALVLPNITWTSADTSVVTVSNGKVEANNMGSTTINTSASVAGQTMQASVPINVVDYDLSQATITLNPDTYTYTGSAIKPTVVSVMIGSKTLVENIDYTVSCTDNVNAAKADAATGAPTVCITGKGNYTGSNTKTFTINPKNVLSGAYTLGFGNPYKFTYDGTAHIPNVLFTSDGITLTQDVDYKITCTNNINVGHVENLTLAGIGNYTGSFSLTGSEYCTISAANLSTAQIVLDTDSYIYDGTAKQPNATVKVNNNALPTNDYDVTYNDNVDAGQASVTVSAKSDNVINSQTVSFTIDPVDIRNKTLVLNPSSATYAPDLDTPSASIEGLIESTDFDISWKNEAGESVEAPVNAGNYTAIATGKGNYAGSVQVSYTINKADISAATIDEIAPQTYTGSSITPSVTVHTGQTELVEGTDFSVTCENNVNACASDTLSGAPTVTITGIGNYEGSKSANFTINKANIEQATAETLPAQTYTGQPFYPKPVLKFNGQALSKDIDYTIAQYENNTEVGQATIIVNGAGNNFEGEKKVYFNIVENLIDITAATVDAISDQTATGQDVKPKPVVRLDGSTLTENKDYTLSYSNNVEPGIATIFITGTDIYTGTIRVTFNIVAAPDPEPDPDPDPEPDPDPSPDISVWKRLYGGTALTTMKAIVNKGWEKSSYAIIVTNKSYQDALSASALAGLMNQCPVLMTDPNELSAQTSALLTSKQVKDVVIIGGTSAISENVESQIRSLGIGVLTRCAGGTAASTANQVYKYGTRVNGGWSSDAILATSKTYQDALSIAPYAYAKKAPIFLTDLNKTTPSNTTLKLLNTFDRTLILGGVQAVSDTVDEQVPNANRLKGGTAYTTCQAAVKFCLSEGMEATHIGIATGQSYQDALCGAALCGKNNSVLVLADDKNSKNINAIVANNKTALQENCYVFGGEKAVSAAVYNALLVASKN